jgi:hypothetical protein
VLTTVSRAKGDAEWTEIARALVTSAEATFKAIDKRSTGMLPPTVTQLVEAQQGAMHAAIERIRAIDAGYA